MGLLRQDLHPLSLICLHMCGQRTGTRVSVLDKLARRRGCWQPLGRDEGRTEEVPRR